ncbi:sulfate/molybdate ABC transporter ATP-binding protein [Azospirillum doebereinerae]|uniref:sulfate/molybdate ABC transporter ATP-binding protein n=1 Tax=Azospirillum doebereinerae TaxID=92933 RepID=UPI001EE590FB|nr:sulfate ABC transporter ATP-binding protein [Azospirillum doebereinerae]MCG5244058.1 sulfate ABC transporter ATP-binding protein [Azospirillum doebereinerae]
MAIQVSGITKRFGAYTALDAVDLEVRSGELLALLGPSGSGKTTLLRIMAGLESPDSGSLQLNGEEALGLKPRDRQVGFVFQHYALFRHMTVFDNVAFGLNVRPRGQRFGSAEIKRRVTELLELVQLGHFADRYPAQLSGGQRQRVALARALAIEPKVLLLDEPFGALDAKVRKELRRWLRKLHDDIHITSVFVTHDQEEALELADRVVVMSQGRIEQIGSPADVYDHPSSAFVYEFLGQVNRFDCTVENGVAQIGNGALSIATDHAVRGAAIAYVRPHDLGVSPAVGGPGRVSGIHVVGPDARVEIELAGLSLEAEMDRERLTALGIATGDRCAVHIDRARVFAR